MIISFRRLGNLIEGKTLWHINCLTILCGKSEMQGFLRKGAEYEGCCGIFFTSTPYFGPLILPLLEEFYLMYLT